MSRRRPSRPARPCPVPGFRWQPLAHSPGAWGLFRAEILLFCVELTFGFVRARRLSWRAGRVKRARSDDHTCPTFVVFRGLSQSRKETAMRQAEALARATLRGAQ